MSKTLVLVHGFMGSALNWGPILTRLRSRPELRDWNFVVPDLLGHGGRRGQDALNYETLSHQKLVEDLKSQIPDGPDLVVLGHSFGLRPLLSLATDPKFSARIKALIVEDASPEITPDNAQRLREILSKVPVPFASRGVAKESIDALFRDDPRLAAFLFSNIRKAADGTQDWRFDKPGLLGLLEEAEKSPLWSEWSKYSGPVYVIRGEQSEHLTPARLQRALEARRGLTTQVIQIPQSGHWIHSDQPDVFTEELIKILKVF